MFPLLAYRAMCSVALADMHRMLACFCISWLMVIAVDQTRAPRSAEEVQEHRARLEAEEAEDVAYVARRRARRAAEFARLAAEDRRREAPAGGEKEPAAGGKEKAP